MPIKLSTSLQGFLQYERILVLDTQGTMKKLAHRRDFLREELINDGVKCPLGYPLVTCPFMTISYHRLTLGETYADNIPAYHW